MLFFISMYFKEITMKSKKKKPKKAKSSRKTYQPTEDFFKTNARLNSSQRKYCHCLMSVRSNNSKKISPYQYVLVF